MWQRRLYMTDDEKLKYMEEYENTNLWKKLSTLFDVIESLDPEENYTQCEIINSMVALLIDNFEYSYKREKENWLTILQCFYYLSYRKSTNPIFALVAYELLKRICELRDNRIRND